MTMLSLRQLLDHAAEHKPVPLDTAAQAYAQGKH
jgi:hypothetical protein